MIRALLSIIVTLILVVGLHEAGHAIASMVFSVKIRLFDGLWMSGFILPIFRRLGLGPTADMDFMTKII